MPPQSTTCEYCGETYQRHPQARRNFCSHSCWAKSRTGEKAANWRGGRLTSICRYCGKPFTHPVAHARLRHCSKACAASDRTGARAANWQGGIAPANRRGRTIKAYYAWRAACLTRDGQRCQECGSAEPHLHVHHIKPYAKHPELRYDIANGVTLCKSCHETGQLFRT